MAKKIGETLSKAVNGLSKGIGTLQVNANKVLWGRGNQQPMSTVKYDTKTNSLQYNAAKPPAPKRPVKGNLIDSGLYNALDALNQVDLCNVLSYALGQVNGKKKPRDTTPNKAQKRLYQLQDLAGDVIQAIDKYTAYPNTFIGKYAGIGPNAISPEQVAETTGNNVSGTAVKKYNMYNLLKTIQDTFTSTQTALTPGNANSILTSQDIQDLGTIPGIASNFNVINDFIAGINKYTDYRSISNNDLQKLEQTITKIRAVCIVIQNLDLQSAAALAGNFLGVDIRSQLQQLAKFIDPTKTIPTLKQINNALQSFIAIANRIQATLRTAQLTIRIALVLIKVFRFIGLFLTKLPAPNLYTTTGVTTTLSSVKKQMDEQQDSLSILLKQINGLLAVFVDFIRYLLTNTNELLTRLQTLLVTLEGCDAVKNSDVISQLKDTAQQLEAVRDQLAIYITAYDSKNNQDTTTAGEYSIKVVDEEVVDPSIKNKRRRGVAFDRNGAIVVQSDLTFSTNNAVIINEVKLKLVSKGLIKSNLGVLDANQAAIIAESLSYLDTDDGLVEDLTLPDSFFDLDSPDNEDENVGLGLNAFANKLKGGRRLRSRTRKAMSNAKQQLANQLASEKVTAKSGLSQKLTKEAINDAIGAETSRIRALEEDITTLSLTLPSPTAIALIAQKRREIKAAQDKIAQLRAQST